MTENKRLLTDGEDVQAQYEARKQWLRTNEGKRIGRQKDPHLYNRRISEINDNAIKEAQDQKTAEQIYKEIGVYLENQLRGVNFGVWQYFFDNTIARLKQGFPPEAGL